MKNHYLSNNGYRPALAIDKFYSMNPTGANAFHTAGVFEGGAYGDWLQVCIGSFHCTFFMRKKILNRLTLLLPVLSPPLSCTFAKTQALFIPSVTPILRPGWGGVSANEDPNGNPMGGTTGNDVGNAFEYTVSNTDQ